jgi:hypothetical protein
VAYYPRPPKHPLVEAIEAFLKQHDPRTWRGAMVYATFGFVLGFFLGLR